MSVVKGDSSLAADGMIDESAGREAGREAPPMPDGVGMTIEAVRTMLFAEYGFALDKGDPTLALVVINNAFLHEVHKLLCKHEGALRACMGEATESTVKAIQDEARLFAADFKEAAIQNTLLKVGEHQRCMGEFLGTLDAHLRMLKMWLAVSLGAGLTWLLAVAAVLYWPR